MHAHFKYFYTYITFVIILTHLKLIFKNTKNIPLTLLLSVTLGNLKINRLFIILLNFTCSV